MLLLTIHIATCGEEVGHANLVRLYSWIVVMNVDSHVAVLLIVE